MLKLTQPNSRQIDSRVYDDVRLVVARGQDAWHLREVLSTPQTLAHRLLRWAMLHERQLDRNPRRVPEALYAGDLAVKARIETGSAGETPGRTRVVGHLLASGPGLLIAGRVAGQPMQGITFSPQEGSPLLYPSRLLTPHDSDEVGEDSLPAPTPLPYLRDLPPNVSTAAPLFRDLWEAAEGLSETEEAIQDLLAVNDSRSDGSAPEGTAVWVDVTSDQL
jgi:hypothetical protein